ncbi:hypothetical protein D3C71_1116310 [compost metagenome]
MIKPTQIIGIKSEKLFNNALKVKNLGQGVYGIYGYNYGQEGFRYRRDAHEVAKYLNQYFGYSE